LRAYFVEAFEESWHRALNQVQKDYADIDWPASWPMSRNPEAILTEEFWTQ
jgi:hypothetical protein